MNLFDYDNEQNHRPAEPLASRMRPKTLDDVAGQEHLIGKGKLLYRAIMADKLGSLIFYGPPGTGKTSLAMVIANTTKSSFRQVNATAAGKKDLEEVVREAQDIAAVKGKKTILFIDEIHRFNKAQQDYLLPFVENGTITLIGATTENPFFEVNKALLSRSRIFELKPLTKQDIQSLIEKCLEDPVNGVAGDMVKMTEEAVSFLADAADGDARAALNAVELAVLTTDRAEDGYIYVDLAAAEECIQRKAIRYDRSGDSHYDVISAFIKSMRGSDPDAALYYLARMLEAGEDVRFISRRIMICASEDVGNADPRALTVAVDAALAVERVGMPEGRIILAQAASYVACAPKSNAASAGIFRASEAVRKTGNLPIPPSLQDAHYSGAQKLGRGEGYLYSHDYPNHYVKQQYLPDQIRNEKYYLISNVGYEAKLQNYFRMIGKTEYGREDK